MGSGRLEERQSSSMSLAQRWATLKGALMFSNNFLIIWQQGYSWASSCSASPRELAEGEMVIEWSLARRVLSICRFSLTLAGIVLIRYFIDKIQAKSKRSLQFKSCNLIASKSLALSLLTQTIKKASVPSNSNIYNLKPLPIQQQLTFSLHSGMDAQAHPRLIDLLSDGQSEDQVRLTYEPLQFAYHTKPKISKPIHINTPAERNINLVKMKVKMTGLRNLDIYTFDREAPILRKQIAKKAEIKEKVARCKVCSKKVLNDASRFTCDQCRKSCHLYCLGEQLQCPRCLLRETMRIEKISRKMNRQRMSSQVEIVISSNDERDRSRSPDGNQRKQAKQQTNLDIKRLSLKSVANEHMSQVIQFKQKYGFLIDKNEQVQLPIEQTIIESFSFLKKSLNYGMQPSPPQSEGLSSTFGLLLQIWNFFESLENCISPQCLCLLNLQNFQQNLKTQPITFYLTPLLQACITLVCKGSTFFEAEMKLLVDLVEKNVFQYVSRYFWPMITLKLIQLVRPADKRMQYPADVTKRVQQYFQKRVYIIKDDSQKLHILKLAVLIIQSCYNYKNALNDQFKARLQTTTNVERLLKNQRNQHKSTQKEINKQLASIHELKAELQARTMADMSGQQIQEQLKQLEERRAQLIAQAAQSRYQLGVIKQQLEQLQVLTELTYCSKIVLLGKDRHGRLYYFTPGTESQNILFQCSIEQNPDDSTYVDSWSFYHGPQIDQLVASLNPNGANEHRLKSTILKLIHANIIKDGERGKQSPVKQLLQRQKQVESERAPRANQALSAEIYGFLEATVKQINLSELRQLLGEAQRNFKSKMMLKNQLYQQAYILETMIKNQKFRNMEEIKSFVEKIGFFMYCLDDPGTYNKKRGIVKRKSPMWKLHKNIFIAWRKALQRSTKNSELFFYSMALFLETKLISHEEQAKKPTRYTKPAQESSSNVSESQSSSAQRNDQNVDSASDSD